MMSIFDYTRVGNNCPLYLQLANTLSWVSMETAPNALRYSLKQLFALPLAGKFPFMEHTPNVLHDLQFIFINFWCFAYVQKWSGYLL